MAMSAHRTLLLFASGCSWAMGAAPYDEAETLKFANLAVAAYCGYPHQTDEVLEKWSCGPACDALPGMTSVRALVTGTRLDDAFGFVGKLDGVCVASFRGTTNLPGWIIDLQSGFHSYLEDYGIPCRHGGRRCQVGTGWMKNYRNLRPILLGNLSEIGCGPGSDIMFAGHSLGAATAAIGMFDLKNQGYNVLESYNFGSPRAGDHTFAAAFNAAFGEGHVKRITHYYDPVPRLPPTLLNYHHLPTEVYYDEVWSDGYKVCDSSGEDSSCGSDQWWNVPLMISYCVAGTITRGNCDHLTYLNGVLPYKMDGESCTSSVSSVAPASPELVV